MPANFLSRTHIDEVAAIDPFTPTLAQEQAADPDMIIFKQFFVHKTWPLGKSKSDKNCLLSFISKKIYLSWSCLSQIE